MVGIGMGTVLGQDTNATTFIIFLLLLPQLLLDKPWRIMIVNSIMTLIFICAAFKYKQPGSILFLDVLNAIVVFVLSGIMVNLNVRRQLRVFNMQRKEREEIRKLAIVKNLVDAMDGTITVKSELNKGTEYEIFLTFTKAVMEEKTKHNNKDHKSIDGVPIIRTIENNEKEIHI